MEEKQESKLKATWFVQRFLNNHLVTRLLVILLILLILLVFTKVSHLFTPLQVVFEVAAFPIIVSGVMFYLLVPLVDRMEQKGMSRPIAIAIIFVGLFLLLTWGVASLIPTLQQQSLGFIASIPTYVNEINRMIGELPYITENDQLASVLQGSIIGLDWKSISEQLNKLVQSTFGSLGSVVGTITQVVMGLLTVPIVLYYLLADGSKIGAKLLYYVPTKYQDMAKRMMYQGHYQVSQYIRGQIVVAICVAIMFTIGYTVVGLDYAIALGVLSGFLNIIPYLGSFIAVVPALIIAIITSPVMLVKVIIVMMIEQTIEGRFIAPQVLGNNLKIHPVTILIVLLAAGKAFGIVGVILGVPGYAVMKVIISELYQLYRESSGKYGAIVEEPVTLEANIVAVQLVKEEKHES